jgi:hypothetical protein
VHERAEHDVIIAREGLFRFPLTFILLLHFVGVLRHEFPIDGTQAWPQGNDEYVARAKKSPLGTHFDYHGWPHAPSTPLEN